MRLPCIREAAQYIAEDTAGMTFAGFAADRRTRQLVERNFATIGEAVNRIRRRDPEVVERISSYNDIIGLRNVVIHGYDDINYDAIWEAVQESLPVLLTEVEQLLGELGE
jgi:uncharacterized protein with HEPN domain